MRLSHFVVAAFLQFILVAPSEAQSIRELSKVYDALNDLCRDSAGPETGRACDIRDDVARMLKSKRSMSEASSSPCTSSGVSADIGQRAALLMAVSPTSASKFITFPGSVVWKLDDASHRAKAAPGPTVEADVEVPGDRMKAEVVFEKNTDTTMPASQLVKVHFTIEPGSPSGAVKRIGVLQMRAASMSAGKSLAGAAVPITIDWYLIGLSPGKSEATNTDFLRRLDWIDIPIQLENGRIAKLTLEKGPAGTRDLNAALDAWAKQ